FSSDSASVVSAFWTGRAFRGERLAALRESLSCDGTLRLSGPCGSARGLLPLLLTEKTLLVVVPAEREIETFVDDLRTMARDIGLPGDVLAFPSPGPPPFHDLPRHPDAALSRSVALYAALRGRARALVASPEGLLRPTLAPGLFATRVVSLHVGEEMTPEILIEALDDGGYRIEDPVTAPGQAASRGGILDVFPPDREAPVRVEFFGDTVESMRTFDVGTQRSLETVAEIELPPLSDAFVPRSLAPRLRERIAERFARARGLSRLIDGLDRGLPLSDAADYLPLIDGAVVPVWKHFNEICAVVVRPEEVGKAVDAYVERARATQGNAFDLQPEESLVSSAAIAERMASPPSIWLREIELGQQDAHVACRPTQRYSGDLRRLTADLAAGASATVIFLGSRGRAERITELLVEKGITVGEGGLVEVRAGTLSAGFELPETGFRLLADGDVFPEEVHLHGRSRAGRARGFLSDFKDLRVGDFVVHQDHGIGRFEGLQTLDIDGAHTELMVLSYQGGDKLKIPVHAFDRVQKYKGGESARPVIDRLGSGRWEKVKRRVKKAMRDMAAELLRLYALRKAQPGHAFTVDHPWMREFEAAFEYEETADQAAAIAEVTADMLSRTPMDRLVCGDVGYGKTEVAMRAAMRAVLDGRQVALLAPTTVLAFQHWKTFRQRFAPFPVEIEMISRLRTAREIKAVLRKLALGQVDILVGTHRLLSKDVAFRDLGLLLVDEEQRFGVTAKERLKQMRTSIDCLTLTATPIPRTLQMGLAGIRDMSVIETPPKDRLSIQTSIVRFSTETIAAAIRQELARDGQVFFVHNRVESIDSVAALVNRLAPEARVVVAHGQMPEAVLEKAMLAFVEGRADVLVSTTIIENGLDIPRANTMIVNRADRYGLAQLYQLRGRVGRSDRRAHALLLIPPDTILSELAQKRLAAIREFSDLGAGFRVAALDLELRGAGNLLGGQQSGHLEAVGLDLYIKLLEQTILEMRGEAPREAPRLSMNLGLNLRIPAEYVQDAQQRMTLYKRISAARDGRELSELRREVQDRFGPPPREVDTLLRFVAVRQRAENIGVARIDRRGGFLLMQFGAAPRMSVERMTAFLRQDSDARFTPDGVLRLPFSSPEPLIYLEETLRALETPDAATRGGVGL
ncbi:MAG: transcription-repair coupling factor, partial [Vicinamibacteria bacterium]|nr:transcription-repair coupling factor [Vicinamibacteria bacterium]